MSNPADWAEIDAAFASYAPSLLRVVANRLVRPRPGSPPEHVREKLLEGLRDAVVVDRGLRAVSADARRLLRLAGLFDRPRWPVPLLLDLLSVGDGPPSVLPLIELMDAGLLLPELRPGEPLETFQGWFPEDPSRSRHVRIPAGVAARAVGEPLPSLAVPHVELPDATPRESDGWEVPIRAGALWQAVHASPLRLTINGGFYKRDLDRLLGDKRINGPLADELRPWPEAGPFVAAWAEAAGIARFHEGELCAGVFPDAWAGDREAAIRAAWSALPVLSRWSPEAQPLHTGRWVAFAALVVAALQAVPEDAWVSVADLCIALPAQLPHGRDRLGGEPAVMLEGVLLDVLYALGIVRATQHEERWFVQLTDVTRGFGRPRPDVPPAAPAGTLFIQPNLEIVLYRQGLTPSLLAHLCRVADWKQVGMACQLQLTAESVYRGLESGESFAGTVRWMEQSSGRVLPGNVLESLRTWASRRERVQVYGGAFVLEFANPADLEAALRAGLIEQPLTDRLGLVAQEAQLRYDQIRMIGSREYAAADDQCVLWNAGRSELAIDPQRADLLAETELSRFADRVPDVPGNVYRVTLASVRRGVADRLTEKTLDAWFLRRAGHPTPATIRLLAGFVPKDAATAERMLVVRFADELVTEGVCHWDSTRRLVRERLGPTLVSVEAARIDELRAALAQVGIGCVELD